MTQVLDVSDLDCEIPLKKGPFPVARGMCLSLRGGEAVAITGRSGAGKTTILRTIAGLHPSTRGTVTVAGHSMNASDAERATVRLHHIGFVYQDYRLVEQLTALENVALAARLQGARRDEAMDRAKEMLARVDLSHRLSHRPATLSGGECQRVGIARALMGGPELILADEPTGSLDQDIRDEILGLLRATAGAQAGILVVTHDPAIAAWADRTYRLRDAALSPA